MSDIEDPKNKQAMLWWLPEFMSRLRSTPALASKHVPSHLTFEEYYKSQIDKVVSKTPDERRAWYDKRVEIMVNDMQPPPSSKPKGTKPGSV